MSKVKRISHEKVNDLSSRLAEISSVMPSVTHTLWALLTEREVALDRIKAQEEQLKEIIPQGYEVYEIKRYTDEMNRPTHVKLLLRKTGCSTEEI